MNSYELSRDWFDFCYENPERIKPNHTALFFFAIEHCNRLGWKEKFGFPTTMAMEAIGMKSYNTFVNTLRDLVDFGFIKMIEKSKNQYSANIIALSKYNKALDKALDKAFIKHSTKQSESTVQSIDSIDKQLTIEQRNNITIEKKFSFKNSLLELIENKNLVDDWLKVRKTKKATNTETALKGFLTEVNKTNRSIDEVLTICIENDWKGFKSEWLNKNKDETRNTKGNAGYDEAISQLGASNIS